MILYENSLISLYDNKEDLSPNESIVIRDVSKYLSVGPFTRCISKRPKLKDGNDDLLIAIPKNAEKKEKEILWINCNDLNELK